MVKKKKLTDMAPEKYQVFLDFIVSLFGILFMKIETKFEREIEFINLDLYYNSFLQFVVLFGIVSIKDYPKSN